MRRTQEAAPNATIILLGAPQAVDYYPRVGFSRHMSEWMLRPEDQLR